MNAFEFDQLCASTNKDDAIDAIFDAAHEKWNDEGRASLTEGQLTVVAVWTFFGEVLNGGFYQYFSNESGGLADLAPDALRRVGLDSYAVILERFLVMFPQGEPSEDDDERQSQLDTVAAGHDEQYFEELERPFWEFYRNNNVEFRRKLFAYVVANEGQFVR